MLLDPLSFLERMSKQYGPVVGLVLGGESVVLVTEGNAAQQVLITKAATYKKVRTLHTPAITLSVAGMYIALGSACCSLPFQHSRVPHAGPVKQQPYRLTDSIRPISALHKH